MAALVNRRRCYTGKNSPVSYQIGSYISWRLKTDNIHINTGIKIRKSLEASFQMFDLYDGDSEGGLFCIGGRNTNDNRNTDGIYIYGDRYSNNHTMTLHYMNQSIENKGVSRGMGHTYKITLQNAIIDDTVYTYSSIPTVIEPSYTAYIGGYLNQPDKYSGIASTVGCRLFNIIIDGNEFLPAKRLTDNKIGLYCENLNKFLNFSVFDAEITDYGHYYNEYFTIESLEDENTVSIENVNCSVTPTFYYSLDDGATWSSVTMSTNSTENIATINTGDKIIFKSTNRNLSNDWDKYNRFNGSKNFKVYGNIMSLLYGDDFVNNPEFVAFTSANNFAGLFKSTTTVVDASNLILPSTKVNTNSYNGTFRDCANLVHAPKLPATNLGGKGCYSSMFAGCISLTEAPVLPATTLAEECYRLMFNGCSNLITAPVLPATTLKRDCYNSMFKGCTSLVNTPLLLATTLATSCYNSMFYGCTSLVNAPALPATTLAGSCYQSMLEGCTSLVTTPELPVTTLADNCYRSMFEGCTSLVNAPVLPATTLADNCYDLMFRDCTSLTIAPELPALTLAKSCYSSMFRGCISLAEAPELPATTLADYCYNRMFLMSDSEKLMTPAMTKAPILSATNVVFNCYSEMFKGNGNLNEVTCLTENPGNTKSTSWLQYASPTGTFIKSPLANWNRNTSGIPTGWTVYSDGLLGISISGYDVIDIRENTYSIAYNPSDTLNKYKGVTWSVVSGSATITQDGVLTPTAIGNVVIQAVSTYDSTMVATKSITVQEELPYPQQYFTIESLADSNTISIQNVNCSVKPTFYYSLDGGDTWSNVTMTQGGTQNIATINTGDKILFKSINNQVGTDWNTYNRFNGSKNFKVYGNIMSLLYGDDFVNNTEFANGSSNNFAGLFKSTTTVVDASNLILPSTKVNMNSYNGTFRDCTNLVYAPQLPATNLGGKGCYSSMFEGCISLIEAPELPATTLSGECYARMFCMSRTTKLTTPAMTKSPLLPAATLATNSYKEMFKGNGNLVEITCLATNVGSNAPDWVANISSTGIFKKNANMSSWTTGTSGIPSGWTVIDAS